MGLWEDFIEQDTGAVAVDWVLLTAGLVGLGIATAATVRTGVGDLSVEVRNALAAVDVGFQAALETVASFDFTGGAANGWIGGVVMDMGGALGELLVIGPGQSAGFTLNVPSGAGLATLSFDLIAGDSLDGGGTGWGQDTATVLLNGVPVAVAITSHGQPITVSIPQVDGTTVEAMVTVSPQHLGGSGGWDDSVSTITIEVAQPTGNLQFEVASAANQSINDEFWGIDNFTAGTSQ